MTTATASTSGVGAEHLLQVPRSTTQVADRLFTGTSQRRLHTRNLQEDLRMERYATSIERAKRSTEHDHAFQRKTFEHKSEQLSSANEQLRLRSVREQEAALEAERMAELNRDQLVALMQRLAATQEEELPPVEQHLQKLPPGAIRGLQDGAKNSNSRRRTSSGGSSEADGLEPHQRRKLSTTLEGLVEGNTVEFWDDLSDDTPLATPRTTGDDTTKGLSDPRRKISEPSPHSRKISGGFETSTPRRKISEGLDVTRKVSAGRMRRVSRESLVGGELSRKPSGGSSVMASSPLSRRPSESRMSLTRPPLTRRVSAASFGFSMASAASSRAEDKRSRSTGDAPDISALAAPPLSRRNSQQALDVGDLRRLTRRLSTVKVDYITDPDLMVEQERKVYEFLQKTDLDQQKQKSSSEVAADHLYDDTAPVRKAKPRKSVVYTESAQKQLSNLFGSEVMEGIQEASNHPKPEVRRSSDDLLNRLTQTPLSLPAVYLTRTRGTMLKPRNFSKEAAARKAAAPVHDQFDNLRYCRYLRIAMPWEKDQQQEAKESSNKREVPKKPVRAVTKTVNASTKRMSFHHAADYIKNVADVVATAVTSSDVIRHSDYKEGDNAPAEPQQ